MPAAMWVSLEGMMPLEAGLSQKDKRQDSTYIRSLEQSVHRDKIRVALAKG